MSAVRLYSRILGTTCALAVALFAVASLRADDYLNKFKASTVSDMLRTHPYAIMDGALHANPSYVPASELLHRQSAVA